MRHVSRQVAVALVAVIALSGCARWESQRWQDLKTRSRRQFDEGRYDEALKGAEALIKMRPEHRGGWWMLGSVQQQQGDYEAAAESIRKAIELAPASSQPLLRAKLGRILAAMEDYDGAITNYRQAIELAPDMPHVRGELGFTLAEVGHLDEAAEVLDEAKLRAPDDAWTWYALGALQAKRGEAEPALKDYRKALALDPDLIVAREGVAWALLKLGSHDAAIEQLDAILIAHPAEEWALRQMDNVLRSLGRPADALDYYRRAHEADPANWDTVADLTERLVDAGSPAEALEVLEQSADSLPEGWERWLAARRALALVALGRVGDAREELLDAPEPGEGIYPEHYWMALAWAQVGDMDRAVEEVVALTQEDPHEVVSWSSYAQIQALDGNMAEARSGAKKEREMREDDRLTVTVVPLALALASEGDDAAARRELLQIDHYLTEDLPAIETLYLAGLAYRELGDIEKSNALFQIAIDRWPKHPWSAKMREMMQ